MKHAGSQNRRRRVGLQDRIHVRLHAERSSRRLCSPGYSLVDASPHLMPLTSPLIPQLNLSPPSPHFHPAPPPTPTSAGVLEPVPTMQPIATKAHSRGVAQSRVEWSSAHSSRFYHLPPTFWPCSVSLVLPAFSSSPSTTAHANRHLADKRGHHPPTVHFLLLHTPSFLPHSTLISLDNSALSAHHATQFYPSTAARRTPCASRERNG